MAANVDSAEKGDVSIGTFLRRHDSSYLFDQNYVETLPPVNFNL
jgi:hypothetical protein